jgi:hypothetical protein
MRCCDTLCACEGQTCKSIVDTETKLNVRVLTKRERKRDRETERWMEKERKTCEYSISCRKRYNIERERAHGLLFHIIVV